MKRLEELHREAEREKREQVAKAHLRGSHALKKVHLAQVGKVNIASVFHVEMSSVT